MSERTVIGGTTYEAVGSSTSNLLLRCNGTARIQWGNKLIDLIKNGKLTTDTNNANLIYIILDESEIKLDGLYVLKSEKSEQLWVCKKGERFNFKDANLYISASTKLDFTEELKQLAKTNIGFYYNTLEEVTKSDIKNGIVYVFENKSLYTISNGVVEEFKALLKTIEVEKEENIEIGDIINGTSKIILQVNDLDYLILQKNIILTKLNLVIGDGKSIVSEVYNDYSGFKLYTQNGKSYLDVDYVNVRELLNFDVNLDNYLEITYSELQTHIIHQSLKPFQWYAITDFQNIWRLGLNNFKTRQIVILATSTNTISDYGFILDDLRILIKYDPNYAVSLTTTDDEGNTIVNTTNGRITWMRDRLNNEANFDFLDYANWVKESGNNLITVHNYEYGYSIFPINSYNNKLSIANLAYTNVDLDGLIDHTNDVIVDFKIEDCPQQIYWVLNGGTTLETLPTSVSDVFILPTPERTNYTFYGWYDNYAFLGNAISEISEGWIGVLYAAWKDSNDEGSEMEKSDQLIFPTMSMYDNTINVSGDFLINDTCREFYKNTISDITNVTITNNVTDSIFSSVDSCVFNNSFKKVEFLDLKNCVFDSGILTDITCKNSLESINISSTQYPLLYDPNLTKKLYFNNSLQIVIIQDLFFTRGMIMMHSGIAPIPTGWAICDGNLYTYNGITSTTPNLVGKFIKATSDVSAIKSYDVHPNNQITLEQRHLPYHSHPHLPHTHTLLELNVSVSNSQTLVSSLVNQDYVSEVKYDTTNVSFDKTLEGLETESVVKDISTINLGGDALGGIHSHDITLLSGSVSSEISLEDLQIWSNDSITIEPNYYSLIFIMKL